MLPLSHVASVAASAPLHYLPAGVVAVVILSLATALALVAVRRDAD